VAFDIAKPQGMAEREDLEWVVGDVRDLEALRKTARGCDAVIHTAALLDRFIGKRPRSEFFEINVTGTDNVFQAALDAGVQRVVYSSSTEVYGTQWAQWGAQVLDEQSRVNPETIYGLTKYMGETLALHYARYHDMKVACMRYMTFNEKPPERLGLGLVARYLWVRDVAEANFACVESELVEDDIFCIGPLTPLKQVDVVEAVWNPEAVLERYWPGSVELLKRAGVKIRPNQLYPIVSIRHAMRILGWKPSYTFSDYLEHLRRTLEGQSFGR